MSQSRVLIQLGEITNTCFVVMPFASLFESQYSRVIKPAIEAAGLVSVRGDEIYTNQSIVQDIWSAVRSARLVVAELSGRNPNVMYEIGLAHAIGKPIILLTRTEDDVPFDLKALRYIFYDTNNPEWGNDLRTELTRAIRRILDSPTLAAHLQEIKVETTLPVAPQHPIVSETVAVSTVDLSGVWQCNWISVRKEREHRATLIIPVDHGSAFTTSMTVVYEKEGLNTIVEETLKATLTDRALSLVGVNYTYIEQGASTGYSLDTFTLIVSGDNLSLRGNVKLRHGTRTVTFEKNYGDSVAQTEARNRAATSNSKD